jgi:Fe-S-cluster-containing dehydrogenase component
MAKRIFLNLDLCCGCESCAAACFYSHWQERRVEHAPVDQQALLPMHCLHCEQPACATACPNSAMNKDEDGVVRRSAFKCVGCRSCAIACPFGVIDHNLVYHIVPKCDLCTDKLKEGEIPRCVATCTSGALSFEEVDEVTFAQKRNQVSHRILSNAIGRRR